MENKTWHQKHKEKMKFGDKLADSVANGMGSWKFIIWQTVIVLLWMALNVVGFVKHWDVYPFILLNLIFSTQAAYAAPIIMMSQNRQNQRDREQALHDYQTNIDAKKEIEALQVQLSKIGKVKAERLLKQCKTEKDFLEKVVVAYENEYLEGWEEKLYLAGNLLWIRRKPNQAWETLSGVVVSKENLLTFYKNLDCPFFMSLDESLTSSSVSTSPTLN